MPANTFINFDKARTFKIEGESLQNKLEGSKGWIEISDWSWDIEAETSFMKGGGSAVGKPQPGNFTITHYYDTSSHMLMDRIVAGTHFDQVDLVQLKQTGKEAPEAFLIMNFKYVFINKVSTKGAEDGSVTQDVEFVFKEVAINYRMQGNDGKLEAPIPFNWNIALMNDKTTLPTPVFSEFS